MTRFRIATATGVAVLLISGLVGGVLSASADSAVTASATASATATPGAGRRECAGIAGALARAERLQSRLAAGASTRGSIAALEARVAAASAAGRQDAARVLGDRLALRKDVASILPDRVARLKDAKAVCG